MRLMWPAPSPNRSVELVPFALTCTFRSQLRFAFPLVATICTMLAGSVGCGPDISDVMEDTSASEEVAIQPSSGDEENVASTETMDEPSAEPDADDENSEYVDIFEEIECIDEADRPQSEDNTPECNAYNDCIQEDCAIEYANAFGDLLDGQAGGACKDYVLCTVECCGDAVCAEECEIADDCYIAFLGIALCAEFECSEQNMDCFGDQELPLPDEFQIGVDFGGDVLRAINAAQGTKNR